MQIPAISGHRQDVKLHGRYKLSPQIAAGVG
jgi:hypothetical protein